MIRFSSHPLARSLKPTRSVTCLSHLRLISTTQLKQFNSLPQVMPRNIIFDFDGTITTKDTISTLAKFGIRFQKERGNDVNAAWDEILERYGEDYANHVETYRPVEAERKTIEQEIAYYRSLRDVETRSFKRVSTSGLFHGISREAWKDAGGEMVETGEVIVRNGFREFILKLREKETRCGVVSVNFSRFFIEGVLEASVGDRAVVGEIEVVANISDEDGVLSGPKRRGSQVMATSDAKLSLMRALLGAWEKDRGSRGKTVYVGDSGTDLECLLADEVVGVVMSENGEGSLMKMLRKYVTVEPCAEYRDGKKNILYCATDFEDLRNTPLFSLAPKGNI